jgi:hypothetical protein
MRMIPILTAEQHGTLSKMCDEHSTSDPCFAKYSSLDRIELFGPILLLIIPGSFFLFILLEGLRYGVQLASLIIYPSAVILITFSAQRGQQRYLFTCPVVQSLLPRLVRRHVWFLLALVLIETVAMSVRSHLPVSWLIATGKGMSPFTMVLCSACVILGFTQILTNRSLLHRAHLRRSAS